MGKIAHIRVECPKCGKLTNAYIEESESSSAIIKCENCKNEFTFGPGLMYQPVGYVSSIPK